METLTRIKFVGFLVLFQLFLSDAYLFETDDAVVITGKLSDNCHNLLTIYHSVLNAAKSLSRKNGLSRSPKSDDENFPTTELSSDRSCKTFDYFPGVCMPVAECYPYTKMHQSISNLETWVVGTRGTCNYVEPSGRQVRN